MTMISFWCLSCAVALLGGSGADAKVSYPRTVPLPPGAPEPKYSRLEVRAGDDTKLVVHEWAPPQPAPGKPVVVFLHGIGFHGEPYGSVAAGFTSRGLTFVAPDLRGHGRSEGERGKLAEPPVLRSDIGAVLDFVGQRHPKVPIFLGGESMGGLLAAYYGWRGEKRPAGLVLLVPAFAVYKERVRIGGAVRDVIRNGGVPLDTPENLAASSRDPDFIKAKRTDPLALHTVRPIYLARLARIQLEMKLAPEEFKLPLFVGVAGKDRVIDSQEVERFYEAVATPKREKTLKKWDDAYHTLCWDPQTPQVIQDLTTWVLERPER
jgi:alpha-beta hydrolase superfamily lysophospholipase